MLFIRPLILPDLLRRNYVRCPICKRGRLCDCPAGEQVKVQEFHDNAPRTGVILKCPKCSNLFFISSE